MARDTETEVADDLAKEVAALRKEMQEMASTISRIGRAGVAGARSVAEAKLGEGGDALHELEDRLLMETRARPYRALGLAALGGLALGLLLRR